MTAPSTTGAAASDRAAETDWRYGRKAGIKAAIAGHVAALATAADHTEVEAAFQAALTDLGRYQHQRLKPVMRAMHERGRSLCVAHARGDLVPRFDAGRRLVVCGETYRVGRGQNSTGVRYVWTYAEFWARAQMEAAGLSIRASKWVWDWWRDYPHRALRVVEEFDAGGHRDPEMNILIRRKDCQFGPIRCEIGEDRRAYRPCPACGSGTLFDWGCGWDDRIIPVSWRCNRCPAEYVEYVDNAPLTEIRTGANRGLADGLISGAISTPTPEA